MGMGIDNSPEMTPAGRGRNWQEILIVLAVVAGLVFTVFFSFRLYHSIFSLRHMHLPTGTSDVNLIQGWMTVPYIAKDYQVPETDLWQGLSIPDQANRRKNLNQLDREFAGGKPGVIIERVKSTILAYQTAHPRARPLPPTRTPLP